jgi:hypothetical protein
LAATEFIDGGGGLFLNLNPSLDPNSLVFTFDSAIGSFTIPSQALGTIQTGVNGFKADGDGNYDMEIQWSTVEGYRFGGGESITYTITGISGLVAADFTYLSENAGGYGPFYAAAHIQNTTGGGSCWIEPGFGPMDIPEPASGVLFALAMGLWGALRSRRP